MPQPWTDTERELAHTWLRLQVAFRQWNYSRVLTLMRHVDNLLDRLGKDLDATL